MAKTQSIAAFPAHIDRNAFGFWLSGFTDGEACFGLGFSRHSHGHFPTGNFAICLRADDRSVLELIQRFFGCGLIHYSGRRRPGNQKPQVTYSVRRVEHLHDVVVPFFDRHPLYSKKARDFAIWRSGVNLLHTICLRKVRMLPSGRGTFPKWTEAERGEFHAISEALRSCRDYRQLLVPQVGIPS